MTGFRDQMTRDKKSPSPTFLKSFFSFSITFVLMLLCWLILSGIFEPLILFLAVVSCSLTAYFFSDLLFPSLEAAYIGMFFRFIQYLPWLIWQIVLANFHVLYVTLHPRMRDLIEPQIITFKTNLKSEMAIVTLANSITLTPGTITITADSDGVFKVHAIDKASAEGCPGDMLKKVANIFGETL
ncbi:MAG: Na+/H+ antiporter subunit E [Desulfobacula sp.]|jgi:multicomponent Na+:H+ antiporter subunit E